MKNLPDYLKPNYDAKSDAAYTVCGKNYRFTVLTSCLIRMEYSPDGIFEDRPTQSVVCRSFDKPKFTVKDSGDTLIISTSDISVTYKKSEPFSSGVLNAQFNYMFNMYKEIVWNYGEKQPNLGGTARTLDEANGEIPLGDGVCSRSGFAVIDDSASNIILSDGGIEKRRRDICDIYLFAYGHKYTDAVRDLFKLTGIPPLLPAYALGNWWSRYYAYRQQEYIDLMQRFIDEKVPFSVSVIDMDWHTVDIPKEYGSGWTGYSWNKELFPDYKAFLKWLKEHNLHITLNLHPALGVRAHEDMYEEMAKALGIDPKTKEPVRFDMTNEEFIKAYFEVLHHPYEKDGVDFWWMDWQQGTACAASDLDPLWMLNHYHTLDIQRDGKRPFFFSRFSGAGSQRFPIGFSGDTHITWKSLEFQPYFTATASNIGYPWWSHDIGGHCNGYRDDMLNIRWIQLGVFSPINRLHSSNSPFSGKEPWNYSAEADRSIRKFLRLRHKLFPYLYTMNYRVHSKLIPLIQPLYYQYPETAESYKYKTEFFFGSSMLVAPIVTPSDEISGLGSAKAYLPDGMWIDFFNGKIYKGGRSVTFYRNSDEYPVLCKAGAIIPMNEYDGNDNTVGSKENMEIAVFPGADGAFTLYEDGGEGNDYKNGAYSTTDYTLKWGKKAVFSIKGAKGDLSLIPEKRSYVLNFKGFSKDIEIAASADGKKVDFSVSYDEMNSTLSVKINDINVKSQLDVTLYSEGELARFESSPERIYDILLHAQCDYGIKNEIYKHLSEDLTPEEKICMVLGECPHRELAAAIAEQLSM